MNNIYELNDKERQVVFEALEQYMITLEDWENDFKEEKKELENVYEDQELSLHLLKVFSSSNEEYHYEDKEFLSYLEKEAKKTILYMNEDVKK